MGKMLKVIALFTLLFAASTAKAQTATITWTNVHQEIQGFGAADQLGFWSGDNLTATQANVFFSTTSGAGLSIFRTGVSEGPGGAGGSDCSTVNSSCVDSVSLANMRLAVARGARVFATVFSPPASMKTNGSVICNTGSGDASLVTSSYGAFAAWMSHYVNTLKSDGVDLYAVSVQNEPDYCPTTYEGATWSAPNFRDFIVNNLGPTMAANGDSSTLIMMPEVSLSRSLASYADATFQDSSAAAYVGIAATHNYDFSGASSYPAAQNLGKQLWMTEVSGSDAGVYSPAPYDGSITDALYWSYKIHDWLVNADANAWLYWALIPYSGNPNQGLMNADGVTIPRRLWAMGNWARFVRPGYHRIDATDNPQNGVYVSAFQDTQSGALVIVAINKGGSNISQTFSVANGPDFTSVTPWTTSANLTLEQQSAISASANSFTYTLPASSVTTFVGSASTGPAGQQGGSTPPAPPTITGISVK